MDVKGPGTPTTPAMNAVTAPNGVNAQSFIWKCFVRGKSLLSNIIRTKTPRVRLIVDWSKDIKIYVPKIVNGIAPTNINSHFPINVSSVDPYSGTCGHNARET